MILPNPFASMEGRAAFEHTNGPVRLVLMISSHRSRGISTVGRRKFRPALQMRISGLPMADLPSARKFLICDSFATSALDAKVFT